MSSKNKYVYKEWITENPSKVDQDNFLPASLLGFSKIEQTWDHFEIFRGDCYAPNNNNNNNEDVDYDGWLVRWITSSLPPSPPLPQVYSLLHLACGWLCSSNNCILLLVTNRYKTWMLRVLIQKLPQMYVLIFLIYLLYSYLDYFLAMKTYLNKFINDKLEKKFEVHERWTDQPR